MSRPLRLSKAQVTTLTALTQSEQRYVRPSTAMVIQPAGYIAVRDHKLSMYRITDAGRAALVAEVMRRLRRFPPPVAATLLLEEQADECGWTAARPTPWIGFAIANIEDAETLVTVAKLSPGQRALLGGGASPVVRVTWLSDRSAP